MNNEFGLLYDEAEDRKALERGNRFRKEKVDKLLEGNIVVHMRKLSEMGNYKWDYFYWVSPVWKAIREHIGSAKKCLLIDREAVIISLRGYGPSVNLVEVRLCGGKVNRVEYFNFEFEVEYICEGQMDGEYPKTYKVTYYLDVPVDMELNFKEKVFSEWVRVVGRERDRGLRAEDIKEYKRLKGKLGL